MIKPKRDESLGLGNLKRKNWALLAKWWWSFREQREALWRKVIADKYGVYRYRCLRLFLSIVCRVFWGSIAHLGDESNCWGRIFIEAWAILLERGGGCSWFDDWVGLGHLYVLYPRVFRVVSNKESSVNE